MTQQTIRATLSTGPITCFIRSPEPLTPEQWEAVTTLAEQVQQASKHLTKGTP